MLIPKNSFIAVVALSVLVAAIGGLAPSSAQGLKPAQDVNVVNTPTVQSQQAGPWTVNVGSLPALGLDVRPALPAAPKQWERFVNNDHPDIVVETRMPAPSG